MITKRSIKKLKERASQAFDKKFRDDLQNAVQKHILTGGVVSSARLNDSCKCPEGCLIENKLTLYPFPRPRAAALMLGFYESMHASFQRAFDFGTDNGTPEAALGLLYHNRFITSAKVL